MKMKKADWILIIVVLAAALAAAGFLALTRKEGAAVVVTVDRGGEREEIARLPLDTDAELLLEDGEGGTNRLVIRDGVAYVTEANCPDKVCVESYRDGISYDGETIICLPHKLVVTVEGGEEGSLDQVIQ